MGRKKRKINQDLPKYVYRKRTYYIYRAYLGVIDGKRSYGPEVYLCPVKAPRSRFWQSYEKVTGCSQSDLKWLLRTYRASQGYLGLAEKTQHEYSLYENILISRKTKNGMLFGDASLEQISIRTIRAYLDDYPSPISANRHIQYLKAAWNWVRERQDIPPNPCMGVRLNKQEARTRYVSQEEFTEFKKLTKNPIPIFMELAYLCRARWSEIAQLKENDTLEEGLRVIRGKGSKGEVTAYTPRLLAAIQAAREFNPSAPAPITGSFLIHDKNGKKITRSAFNSAWGRAMEKWEKAGGERFTFHDLKAKGYSDQKIQDAGHKSQRMHEVYMRKLKVVEPAE